MWMPHSPNLETLLQTEAKDWQFMCSLSPATTVTSDMLGTTTQIQATFPDKGLVPFALIEKYP